jgi:hypothetical protein
MTRRHAIGAVAAGSALLADTNEPNVDPVIVKRHDDSVESTLSRQITDPGSRGYGTLPDGSGLYSAHAAAGLLESFTAAFLYHNRSFTGRSCCSTG